METILRGEGADAFAFGGDEPCGGFLGVLKLEGLTTLRIRHDWRTGGFTLSVSKDWARVDWARYACAPGSVAQSPEAVVSYAHEETLALLRRRGAASHLQAVCGLMSEGRHELLEVWRMDEREAAFFNNAHSSVLSPPGQSGPLRLGGIRRHPPSTSEWNILRDGLNLSRVMSFKNAVAGLAFGGCKSVLMSDPVDLDDMELLGFIAYCVERSRCVVAPDMGLDPRLGDVMRPRFGSAITGGLESTVGPTGPPTAVGILEAVKVACGFTFGSESLTGRTVAVMGVGAVGRPLVLDLLNAGAIVRIADPDAAAVARLMRVCPLGALDRVEVIDPFSILTQNADVFCPCAGGAVIGEDEIPSLRYRIIMGSANNVLKATSAGEEIRLARLLRHHGILYQVEWVQGVGGVMTEGEEWKKGVGGSLDSVLEDVKSRVRGATLHNLETAAADGTTPTEVAYAAAERRLFP